ncbi:hypothetical protein C8F04DRAFT_353585 [Mycena alexandri]|uniref:Uncharacterized protein n=1 Tax=Mycena alexandri TaxID=1745969 RepID=A0AAD6T734_9AGAR|nr:hypothetical protein C8F04DRAFT_353585 [Mycena alexandri]
MPPPGTQAAAYTAAYVSGGTPLWIAVKAARLDLFAREPTGPEPSSIISRFYMPPHESVPGKARRQSNSQPSRGSLLSRFGGSANNVLKPRRLAEPMILVPYLSPQWIDHNEFNEKRSGYPAPPSRRKTGRLDFIHSRLEVGVRANVTRKTQRSDFMWPQCRPDSLWRGATPPPVRLVSQGLRAILAAASKFNCPRLLPGLTGPILVEP